MTFKFDFSENSAADSISETEQVMRDVIYEVMNQRYGINWETDERTGFSDFEIRALEERRNQERSTLGDHLVSNRLLDYSYISDLEKIICKNWPEFSQIFPSRETTSVYMKHIGKYRNPVIHKRRGIVRHQNQLCIGMCGELMLHIHRWKTGFKRLIIGYHCTFSFSALASKDENDETLKKNARRKAEDWISKIEKLATKKY